MDFLLLFRVCDRGEGEKRVLLMLMYSTIPYMLWLKEAGGRGNVVPRGLWVETRTGCG
jgi:hypothetical protein